MRLRLKHTWGFMFLVAVYAPTEVSEADEKEMFYAKLDSILDQYPPCQDTLIVLGDFNAVTGIARVMCWSPWLWYQNTNSSLLLSFAKFRRLRIQVFYIKDQSCTTGLGIAMPEG